MNGTKLQLTALDGLGDAPSHGTAISKVELFGDTDLEHVKVHRQRYGRLHHMQIVHALCVTFDQSLSQEIRLFLIITFNVDAIKRPNNRL